jgi:intracellular multiplication protein IcmV
MALKDVVKLNRKTFVNPRGWLGYDLLKTQTLMLWDILKNAFTPAKPTRSETFEQAMQRLKLTEADVQESKESYFSYAIGFVILACVSLAASFYYLIQHGTFAGFLLGIATTGLFLAQAFRFHFWYFQIKHKKLGCTFDEWRKGRTNEEKGGGEE